MKDGAAVLASCPPMLPLVTIALAFGAQPQATSTEPTLATPRSAALQDYRQVEVRIEAPNGTTVSPAEQECKVDGRIIVEDGTGWPLRIDVWPRDNTESAFVFEAPVGSTLQIAAFLPPYPIAEQQIPISAGNGPQASTLRFEQQVEKRTLRIDLAPEEIVNYHEYYLHVLSPSLSIPFLSASADEIRKGIPLPADTYLVRADGHYIGYCGNTAPAQADFLRYLTKADLRTQGKAIRIRPKEGELLRFRVTNPGFAPPTRTARRKAPWMFGIVTHESLWARLRLVNVTNGRKIEPNWGWRSMSFCISQAGFPLGTEVYTTDRIPAGTYDIQLRGLSIQPLSRRIVVQHGTNDTILLTPKGR